MDDLKMKVAPWRERLKDLEEEYKKAVRSRKTYNTLRFLRDQIKELEEQIDYVENMKNIHQNSG